MASVARRGWNSWSRLSEKNSWVQWVKSKPSLFQNVFQTTLKHVAQVGNFSCTYNETHFTKNSSIHETGLFCHWNLKFSRTMVKKHLSCGSVKDTKMHFLPFKWFFALDACVSCSTSYMSSNQFKTCKKGKKCDFCALYQKKNVIYIISRELNHHISDLIIWILISL